MKRVKIKIDSKDFMETILKTERYKDLGLGKIQIEGELVEDSYMFSIGNIVFVKQYYDTHSYDYKKHPRILGGRWGKVTATNIDSPKRVEEGELYFVEGRNLLGGWEKLEDLELIVPHLSQ